MKVLMLTSNSSLLDGINRHILNIAPILNSMDGIEVRVCTVQPRGELHEALNKVGVKTFYLGYRHGHSLGIIGDFSKIIKGYQPDIIHSHVMSIMQRFYCSYAARGIKYVETIHGISDKRRYSLKSVVEKALMTISPIKYKARCYISHGVKNSLIRSSHIDEVISEVCYNPISFVPTIGRGNLQRLIGVSVDTQVIGTACRLSTVKNPQAFTDVMCRVLVNMPNVNAVVLGDGPNEIKDDCKDIVREYHIGSRFHWLGYRSDASQLIADMKCFVMTSHSEGMPTSLLECFVARTPVALFEGNGGLMDIAMLNSVDWPIAAMVHAGDNEGLSLKIKDILNSPEMAESMTKNAYNVARDHFDVQKICTKITDIYKAIL